MKQVNMIRRSSTNYIGSADTSCETDMIRVEEVRSIVKTMNKYLRESNAVDRRGMKLQYRVSLKGREAIQKEINPRTGNPISYNLLGDLVGGVKNAGRIDVYIHQRYDW
jgi:hypothetical protein